MFKKVLIILPYKIDEGAQEQNIHYIYETYLKKLVNFNMLPLLCPSNLSISMIEELYHQADGVLLLGGGDIDPAIYNQPSHSKTKVTNYLRDKAEIKVIRMAIQDKKPILGICRGMQMVNCILGGTLIQHLPDLIFDEEHYVIPADSTKKPSYDDVASDRDQFMTVLNGTNLEKIISSNRFLVHCAHHQSIDKVAPGLRVNAKSDKGVIEGLELEDKTQYLMLLQNHIETQDNDFSNKIWKNFAKAL